MWVAPK
jgi:hypothetical protein